MATITATSGSDNATAHSFQETIQSLKVKIQSFGVGSAKQWLQVVVFFFVASILVNVYSYYENNIHKPKWQPSWSLKAARDAEVVAAIDCSGNGDAFLDGIVSNGAPECECYPCYKGADCSEFIPNCVADVINGDALFLEDYWKHHASESSVLISGWHRMPYNTPGLNFRSIELEKHIALLHEAVGNAVTKDRYIVYGNGMHQLLNAATFALSQTINSADGSPAKVVAWVPHYGMFKSQTKYFTLKGYEWEGNASDYLHLDDTSNFIEIVTSPNNPDCQLRHSILKDAKSIYDLAYYWPHFTAIPTPYDEEVMMFTMSKFTGHAGSRFGWAVIKDERVYKGVMDYLRLNTVGVSRDVQLRVLTIIKTLLLNIKKDGRDLNTFGFNIMKKRWNTLSTLVSSSKRFSLQKAEPQYCDYFKTVRDPSPAYGWLKCEREEDEDCADVFKKGGILAMSGTSFETSRRYIRLSIIKTQEEFDLMIERMKLLVNKTPRIQNFNITKLPSGEPKRPFI